MVLQVGPKLIRVKGDKASKIRTNKDRMQIRMEGDKIRGDTTKRNRTIEGVIKEARLRQGKII